MQKNNAKTIADELGMKPKVIMDKAKDLGIAIKTVSSAVSDEDAQEIFNYILTGESAKVIKAAPNTHDVESKADETIPSAPQEAEPVKADKKTAKKATPNKTAKATTSPEESSVTSKKRATSGKKKESIETSENRDKEASLVTSEISKEETPVQQETTPLPAIESELPKETLAQATVEKRVGLRIVKKRSETVAENTYKESLSTHREERSEATPKGPSKALSTLKALLGNQESEARQKKKKNEAKKSAPTHKKNEQRIDLLGDRELSSRRFDEEQDQDGVVLFDLNAKEEEAPPEEVINKKLDTGTVRVQRWNPFMEQGIRRGGRKRSPRVDSFRRDRELLNETIKIPEEIRAYEFADKTGKSIGEVIKVLFNLGLMVTKNDFLDRDSIEILAEELKLDIAIENASQALEYTESYNEEVEGQELSERPPVVTIMGHVDHGKTSLLDCIRNTKVAAKEAGGITQHIGAYTIAKNGKKISFIDTPGHEAFTEMRARGAGVTDIVIIVIAADDGVKQQTIEALNHAKAADAPIIIALNKIDKPGANADKAKAEAAELGYSPLEWGGNYEFVPVSAKTGEGVDTLLETILLQAELLELKANPNRTAKAVVIESSLEKGKGPVATVIVQNGTLKVGDSIVADTAYGRVRALVDDEGRSIQSIGPSEVAVITGLSESPVAGATLLTVESDSVAREYAEKRALYLRQKELSRTTKVSFDELGAMVAEGRLKSLPVIIKADTQGSLEAIKGSLEKLRNEEVKVNIIHSGVGGITESDVILGGASENSVILGFNVRPTGNVKNKAKELGVQVKTYTIIYALIDEIKAILGGMMSPVTEEEHTGQAEVRDTFTIAKVGTIAGCFVTDGTIHRGIKVRLIRNGVVIFTGNISSLKRFKDDAREVTKGYECGIMLEGFNDIRIGDVFETFREVEKARKL